MRDLERQGKQMGNHSHACLQRSFSSWGAARLTLLAVIAVLCLFGTAPQSFAQDLSAELERLRRDLVDLQRFVYAGKAPSGSGSTASSGSVGQGGVSSEVAGRLQVKVQQFERQMRELHGRFEEVEFRLRQLDESLTRQANDNELRFQRLEQALGVAAGGAAATGQVAGASSNVFQSQPSSVGSLSTGTVAGQAQSLTTLNQSSGQTLEGGTTVVSSAGTTIQSGDQGLQSGQQSLGTLRLDSSGRVVGAEIAPEAAPQPAASQSTAPAAQAAPVAAPVTGSVGTETVATASTTALPDGTPKEQYDYALTLLLRKRDYTGAEAALKQFIDVNAGDPLAGSAMYWLGETYYVRENYRDAAAIFVDSFTNFPDSGKASHSLLKLGMSLGALGKTDAACTAFITLKEKYPNAEARVLRTADAESTRFGCS